MSSDTEATAHSQQDLGKAALLDEEGDLSPKFESALIRIFARFSTSYRERHPDVRIDGSNPSATLPRPNNADVLTEADLDAFSTVTNGAALPQESKDEIKEFLDTDQDGNITLRGFIEMYHLQSDNEPEETWKDLEKLGFDNFLEYTGASSAHPEGSGKSQAGQSKEADDKA